MIEELGQMLEISNSLMEAAEKNDIDRIVALLKRRKELTERMGKLDPKDPDVQSGKVAEILKDIVTKDGEIEGKIRSAMSNLQDAINAVQGEKKVVKGYLKQSAAADDQKFIDKEG